jgi:8-oxo-dGTP diphosphatase
VQAVGFGLLQARSVSALVFDQTGQRVLMHLRGDVLLWSLPGGGVEIDESWETATVREVLEETGYKVVIDRLVGEYSRPDLGDVKRVYRAQVVGGQSGGQPPETVRVGWIPVRRLPANRLPGHRAYIEDGLRFAVSPVRRVQIQSWPQRIAMRIVFGLANLTTLVCSWRASS